MGYFWSAALGNQRAEVERLVALGASHLDLPGAPGQVAMADPDGNEFWVLLPD